MIVTEPWWVLPGIVGEEACDRIVELGLSLQKVEGTLRDSGARAERKTDVAWIREDWVYDLVEPWAYRANREAGWGFDIERTQSLQFGVYPVGGHYDWHLDQTGRPYDARDSVHANFHGLLRKVSFSVELSDPDSYEGGVLEMEVGLPGDPDRVQVADVERRRGTMIAFPSCIPHRVTPVTRGTRYSLVGWICGRPWR